MTQELQTFTNPIFGDLEILSIDGKEYFPASKVASILGYKDPDKAIRTHCLEDGGAFYPIIDSLGRMQHTKFINEGNLYRLIIKSRLPQAQQFERWVFDEVLPTIRKTGAYFTEETWNRITSSPGEFANFLWEYQKQIDALKEENSGLEKENRELKPSAEKWDNWLSSKYIYTVHQASHILGIKGMGLKNLFKYFRENGFVSEKNIAFKQFQDQGLFRVKEIDTIMKNGYRYHRFQTFLTPKGIDYFKTRLINEGYKDLDFYGEPEGMISDYVAA